jgi:hypothetical protein
MSFDKTWKVNYEIEVSEREMRNSKSHGDIQNVWQKRNNKKIYHNIDKVPGLSVNAWFCQHHKQGPIFVRLVRDQIIIYNLLQ